MSSGYSKELVELEFGDVGFCGGRKTGKPGQKRRSKSRINNKLNPLVKLIFLLSVLC